MRGLITRLGARGTVAVGLGVLVVAIIGIAKMLDGNDRQAGGFGVQCHDLRPQSSPRPVTTPRWRRLRLPPRRTPPSSRHRATSRTHGCGGN